MQRIGVFGGTFDPFHNGQVHTALELAEYMRLDKVHMVPCFQPVHRTTPSTLAEHRLAMLQAACQEYSTLVADDRELRREGPSYSIDTMQDFRSQFEDAAIFMVMGADAFEHFGSWYRADEFLNLVNIVVVHRGGEPEPQVATSAWASAHRDVSSEIECSRGALTSVQLNPWTTSSTAIRRALSTGVQVDTDLPDAVARYIDFYQLYR